MSKLRGKIHTSAQGTSSVSVFDGTQRVAAAVFNSQTFEVVPHKFRGYNLTYQNPRLITSLTGIIVFDQDLETAIVVPIDVPIEPIDHNHAYLELAQSFVTRMAEAFCPSEYSKLLIKVKPHYKSYDLDWYEVASNLNEVTKAVFAVYFEGKQLGILNRYRDNVERGSYNNQYISTGDMSYTSNDQQSFVVGVHPYDFEEAVFVKWQQDIAYRLVERPG